MELEAEVCVVGGGPAGAAAAARLARLGHDVLLVEAEPFPRPRVGESLTPGILPLLDSLGVRDEVESAGFFRPRRAVVRWAGVADERPEAEGEAGFQVDRGRFDHILLRAAASAGARLVQPARAFRAPAKESGGPSLLLQPGGGGRAIGVRTRFVVDACGRAGLLGGRKCRLAPPTVALYGYWRETPFRGPEARVEAGREQWYWGAPLPDGTFNAAVFVDPRTLRPAGYLETAYRGLLAQSELLADCLTGSLVGGVRVCAATASAADDVCGDGWLKVGEAAVAVDPLSSQGVQLALAGGLQGAAIVHTLLTAPAHRQAAVQFARNRQAEATRRHAAIAATFYRARAGPAAAPFWYRRGAAAGPLPPPTPEESELPALSERVAVSPRTRIVQEPVLNDDLIQFCPAVIAPDSDRPVAFLGSTPVAALIERVVGTPTLQEVVATWSGLDTPARAISLALWALRARVIVRVH